MVLSGDNNPTFLACMMMAWHIGFLLLGTRLKLLPFPLFPSLLKYFYKHTSLTFHTMLIIFSHFFYFKPPTSLSATVDLLQLFIFYNGWNSTTSTSSSSSLRRRQEQPRSGTTNPPNGLVFYPLIQQKMMRFGKDIGDGLTPKFISWITLDTKFLKGIPV